MATIQALKVSSTTEQMPGVGDGQSVKTTVSTYTYAGAPGAGDVIQSALIQAGSVITDVTVVNGTGASISVGYYGQPAYFIAAGSTVAVARMNVANAPLVMATNGYVIATVASGGAAGLMTMIISFTPRNA